MAGARGTALLVALLTGHAAAASAAEVEEDTLGAGERTSLVAVGQQAPAMALDGSDGARYVLAERRGEGSTVLVFFRGTW